MTFNALGSYYENIIIHSPVKLQGVGPGGVYADGTNVQGTVLDGTGFGTDTNKDTAWQATLNSLGVISGPTALAAMPEGEVVLLVHPNNGLAYTSSYKE